MQRTNFKMEYENIEMTKGDTVAFNCELFDENNNPMEVDTAFFTLKNKPIRRHDECADCSRRYKRT